VTTEGAEVTGGEVRWIEIAKQWTDAGNEVHILTPRTGEELCEKLHLDAKFHISDRSAAKKSLGSMVYNYAFRTLKARFALPQDVLMVEPDLIYSATEHYYDTLPAAFLKRKTGSRWAAVVHWVAPLKREGNPISNLFFYIQQRLGLRLVKKHADSVLAVSDSTRNDLLRLGFPSHKLHVVGCGVDLQAIADIAKKNKGLQKSYDGVYMKRFHPAKGIFDVVSIWNEVVRSLPDARLILIGGGSPWIISRLEQLIESKGLRNNILLMGTVYDFEQKITLLLKSKLFLLPSHEENWAIVIGEALACGLPVICYDLPEIRPVWKDRVTWVRKGETVEFAAAVLQMLRSNGDVNNSINAGVEYMKPYDWHNLSDEELQLIMST
jgi:glycosyltransferase involved in cell wall biosynthesis